MKTKKQIVLETIQFYGSDPTNRRSTIEKGEIKHYCVYNGPDGKHCAFARFVKTELQPKLPEGKKAFGILSKGLDLLLPEVSHLAEDRDFWQQLQDLHDNIANWNLTQGLSEFGKNFVASVFQFTQEDLNSITFDPLQQ